METSKVLSGLSYLSVLFAGILFPLILYFATDDKRTKHHAKKAFLSHLIMIIPIPFVVIFGLTQIGMSGDGEIPVLFFVSVIMTILVNIIVVIWNLIKGIQIFTKETL